MTYLTNAWYAAAFSAELSDVPLRRVLLGNPIVLYRATDGAPIALLDRCAHRFAPLSKGKIRGDHIECPYHGLRFDAAGRCVYNPHGNGVTPKQARVRAYPLTERYGVVWLWAGDSARADASMLPTFLFLENPQHYATVSGYLHVAANYQLITDNLLDLSHAQFLHPAFVPAGPSQPVRTEVQPDGNTLWCYRWRPNSPTGAMARKLLDFASETVDQRFHMHWFPPAMLHFDLGFSPAGKPDAAGLSLPAAHLITPETEFTSHYFWLQSRNVHIHDPAIDEFLHHATDSAFRNEDAPMIEAQQAAMGVMSDLMLLKPVLLSIDSGPVQARRMLTGLIEKERGASGSTMD